MKTCPEFSLFYWAVAFCTFLSTLEWRAIDPYHVVASKHLFLYFSVFLSFFQSSSAEAGVADRWALDINTENLGDFPICLWVLAMWSRVVGWDGGYSPGSAFQSFCIMWKSAFAAPLSPFSFAARRKNKQDWFYLCKAWKHNFVLFGTSRWDRSYFQLLLYSQGVTTDSSACFICQIFFFFLQLMPFLTKPQRDLCLLPGSVAGYILQIVLSSLWTTCKILKCLIEYRTFARYISDSRICLI